MSSDVEYQLIEALNRQYALLKVQLEMLRALRARVEDGIAQKASEQEWYDSTDAANYLKVCSRTLHRIRQNHPQACQKVMGKWYYNISLLMMFRAERTKQLP